MSFFQGCLALVALACCGGFVMGGQPPTVVEGVHVAQVVCTAGSCSAVSSATAVAVRKPIRVFVSTRQPIRRLLTFPTRIRSQRCR